MKVRDLMSTDLVTVTEDTPLKEAARRMAHQGVSGLPVVRDGRVVGVVSEADFVDRVSGPGPMAFFRRAGGRRTADLVGETMSPRPIVISEEASHVEAARLMKKRRVKRLPVVDEGGMLVGIISRSDILSVFARADADVGAEIRRRLIGEILGLEPLSVSVEVEDGLVRLEGTVPTSTEARLLEAMSADVPGVIGVVAHLHYLVDDTPHPEQLSPLAAPRRRW